MKYMLMTITLISCSNVCSHVVEITFFVEIIVILIIKNSQVNDFICYSEKNEKF